MRRRLLGFLFPLVPVLYECHAQECCPRPAPDPRHCISDSTNRPANAPGPSRGVALYPCHHERTPRRATSAIVSTPARRGLDPARRRLVGHPHAHVAQSPRRLYAQHEPRRGQQAHGPARAPPPSPGRRRVLRPSALSDGCSPSVRAAPRCHDPPTRHLDLRSRIRATARHRDRGPAALRRCVPRQTAHGAGRGDRGDGAGSREGRSATRGRLAGICARWGTTIGLHTRKS